MHIIDSDNYAASGIETMFFSGGEPHVKLVKVPDDDLLLFLKLRTWNDVGIAACLVDALNRRMRIDSTGHKVTAFIPYFPAARQDKTDGTAPLTAQIVGRLFSTGLIHVTSFDIHSRDASFFSGVSTNLMPSDLKIPIKDNVVGIIAPDHGAVTRATNFRDKFYPHVVVLECSKKRNQQTGELSDYVMPLLPKCGRYIIVDDICDGGRTFNLLAQEFVDDRLSAESHLELFVSHGIFSRGVSNLHPAIEHVTTTDSWCKGLPKWDDNDPLQAHRLTILPLAQLFYLLGK